MTPEHPDTIPVVAPRITTRLIGDEAFLMNLDTRDTYVLNDTAARVWALIDGGRTAADIAAALRSKYDVDDAECADSVRRLLGDLAGAGLILNDRG